jgi:hypothetical protein
MSKPKVATRKRAGKSAANNQVPPAKQFTSSEYPMNDPGLRARAIRQTLRELATFKRRHPELSGELAGIFVAIDAAEKARKQKFEPDAEIHFQLTCLIELAKVNGDRAALVHRMADRLLEPIRRPDDTVGWKKLAAAERVLLGGRVDASTWKDRQARSIIEHAMRAKRPRHEALYDALRRADSELRRLTPDDVRAAFAPRRGPNAVLAYLHLVAESGKRPSASEIAKRAHRYRQMK